MQFGKLIQTIKLKAFSIEELSIAKEERILIVAPHPDDESIGCGGILLKYGPQCDVVMMTDGSLGDYEETKEGSENICQIRKEELEKAMDYVRVHKLIYAGGVDGELWRFHPKGLKLKLKKYNHIFIPGESELHPDHLATYRLMRKKIRRQHAGANIYGYEVWAGQTSPPTHYLNISSHIEDKKHLIGYYTSQLKYTNYVTRAVALNHYRGMTFGVDYAECYHRYGWSTSKRNLLGGIWKFSERVAKGILAWVK
ncbi:MAG: PIG-L family deacetylase [Lachnospiraceae bacterium]|nr:PIG-L family deacetylase [Lachnospiraceae bacterium]